MRSKVGRRVRSIVPATNLAKGEFRHKEKGRRARTLGRIGRSHLQTGARGHQRRAKAECHHRRTGECRLGGSQPVAHQQQTRNKVRSTYPIEEDGRLAQNMPRLNELSLAGAEGLIALVHLEHAGLMFGKLDVELVSYLLHAWTNDGERGRIEEGSDGDIVLLDSGGEEADAAGHLVYSAYFADEGALEGVHFGVELRAHQHRSGGRQSDTTRTSLNWTFPSSPSSATVSCATSVGIYSCTRLICSEPTRYHHQRATRLEIVSWTHGTDWGSRQPWLEVMRVWQRKIMFLCQTCSAPSVDLDSSTPSCSCRPLHLK